MNVSVSYTAFHAFCLKEVTAVPAKWKEHLELMTHKKTNRATGCEISHFCSDWKSRNMPPPRRRFIRDNCGGNLLFLIKREIGVCLYCTHATENSKAQIYYIFAINCPFPAGGLLLLGDIRARFKSAWHNYLQVNFDFLSGKSLFKCDHCVVFSN
jgi:hypothetical protein